MIGWNFFKSSVSSLFLFLKMFRKLTTTNEISHPGFRRKSCAVVHSLRGKNTCWRDLIRVFRKGFPSPFWIFIWVFSTLDFFLVFFSFLFLYIIFFFLIEAASYVLNSSPFLLFFSSAFFSSLIFYLMFALFKSRSNSNNLPYNSFSNVQNLQFDVLCRLILGHFFFLIHLFIYWFDFLKFKIKQFLFFFLIKRKLEKDQRKKLKN